MIEPILPVEVDGAQLPRYLADDRFGLQQKVDGHRVLVTVDNAVATARSKKGLPHDLPTSVRNAFLGLHGTCVFDGELLGTKLWLFDLPTLGEEALEVRHRALTHFAGENLLGDSVRVVPMVVGHEAKTAFAMRLLANNAEGVVLKRLDSGYTRSAGWLKVKFWRYLNCQVTRFGVGGHDNFEVGLLDDDQLVPVAEVSRHVGDGPHVKLGDVVSVKHLYAGVNCRLVHPTLPRIVNAKPDRVSDMVLANKEVLSP